MPSSPKTAIVVGASSGIGAALTRELVHRGYRVAALARREEALQRVAQSTEDPGRVSVHVHDVTDQAQAPLLFQQLCEELGGLDMLIYNAGIMPAITLDTWDTAQDLEILNVNLQGAIAWGNAAASYFKARGQGHIVGISSIAGDRGRLGNPAYNTSKAALTTYLESLRNRLHRHGVRVTTIKPSWVATPMLEGVEGTFWVASPETAARQSVDAAERGVAVRYTLRRWALVGLIIRLLPSFIFRRLNF